MRAAAPALLLALLLPVMVLLSRDYGVTWDELPRQAYGEKVWRYYEGRVAPSQFRTDPGGSHLYGALFDLTAVGLQTLLPWDRFVVRHALNALVGWVGILACYVLAARLGGPTAGLIALALLAAAPRYWADTMNNPKDLPFAACATASLAVMAGIPARFPFLTASRAVALGVAIGLSLGVRPGGLLFLGYACVVVAVQVVRSGERDLRRLGTTAGMYLLVVAIATTVPLPFWPWLQQTPYVGLIDALAGVSHFEWRGTVLFDGAEVHSMRLPWTYVPTWLLYTTPVVTLAGVLLAVPLLIRPTRARAGAWGLAAAAVFPIAYVIVKQSTLYDGMRHLLFIVPPLAAMAALGWSGVMEAGRPMWRIAAVAGLLVGLAEPIAFSLRNHPNQTVYFNPVLGGPRRAVGRFELDYWGNCLLQSQQRAAAMAIRAGIPVSVSGHRWRMMGLNAGRLPQLAVTRPEQNRHHLEIVLHRGSREQLRMMLGRGDVVDRVVTADGAVLCSTVPGPAYAALEARLRTREPVNP